MLENIVEPANHNEWPNCKANRSTILKCVKQHGYCGKISYTTCVSHNKCDIYGGLAYEKGKKIILLGRGKTRSYFEKYYTEYKYDYVLLYPSLMPIKLTSLNSIYEYFTYRIPT
ncbi:MAG: hypothetical protein HOB26_01330 [Flavobacteriales bacterium]|nr:hypothetical protein [Flavobacteriales bacterium]MBT6745181.1 hypothetical protein [Flavobacteriales bacterium]